MTIVDDINSKVGVAREHVNRGEYASASQNFGEVLYLVDRSAHLLSPASGLSRLLYGSGFTS